MSTDRRGCLESGVVSPLAAAGVQRSNVRQRKGGCVRCGRIKVEYHMFRWFYFVPGVDGLMICEPCLYKAIVDCPECGGEGLASFISSSFDICELCHGRGVILDVPEAPASSLCDCDFTPCT